MQIVKVRYRIEALGTYSSREYSYYSEDTLAVGDLVNVPARDTIVRAQVSAIDVPEEEVAAFADKLKTIPAGSVIKEEPVRQAESYDEYQAQCNEAAGAEAEAQASADAAAIADLEAAEQAEHDRDMATTAVINIAPADDLVVRNLVDEANRILRYAQERVIRTNADLVPATEDVSTIAKLLKALKGKKEEYIRPIKNHLDAVSAAFGTFMHPLEEADVITRDQMKAFRQEQERRRKEADDIETQKMELARREAELKGGEITIDLTPVERPEAVPDKVHTAVGSSSTMKVRKYRIMDFAILDDKYKVENAALLNRLTKAGIPEIEGVEFYWEETLRVNLH